MVMLSHATLFAKRGEPIFAMKLLYFWPNVEPRVYPCVSLSTISLESRSGVIRASFLAIIASEAAKSRKQADGGGPIAEQQASDAL